jgi:hypothetical protein
MRAGGIAMDSTRRAFFLSLAVSLFTAWFYFGFPPLTQGILPMNEGTLVNTLIKIVAIPLTLAIIAGGGLAAAYALAIATDLGEIPDAERRKLALAVPAGIVWVVFVAMMAFPLGPVGNAIVVGASALAILRMLQNTFTLGVLNA